MLEDGVGDYFRGWNILDFLLFVTYSIYSVLRVLNQENTVLGLKTEANVEINATKSILVLLNTIIIF
jgi:hypothetical protein